MTEKAERSQVWRHGFVVTHHRVDCATLKAFGQCVGSRGEVLYVSFLGDFPYIVRRLVSRPVGKVELRGKYSLLVPYASHGTEINNDKLCSKFTCPHYCISPKITTRRHVSFRSKKSCVKRNFLNLQKLSSQCSSRIVSFSCFGA